MQYPDLTARRIFRNGDLIVDAILDSTMARFRFFIPTHRTTRKVVLKVVHKERMYLFIQSGMILLQGQHIVASTIDNLFGDVLLAASRIDGNDRVFKVDLVQQFRDRSDLVRLFFGRHLTETNTLIGGPSADNNQRPQPLLFVMRSP